MTETATLPGLETVDPPVPEGEPKRWIERKGNASEAATTDPANPMAVLSEALPSSDPVIPVTPFMVLHGHFCVEATAAWKNPTDPDTPLSASELNTTPATPAKPPTRG